MRLFVPKWLKSKLPAMVQKIFACASTVLHNMGNQAQVALDEYVAGTNVTLGSQIQIIPLLLGGQGFWKTAGLQLQGIHHACQHQPYGGVHIRLTSAISYATQHVRFPESFLYTWPERENSTCKKMQSMVSSL